MERDEVWYEKQQRQNPVITVVGEFVLNARIITGISKRRCNDSETKVSKTR